jgi:Ca-activated chloride channel family protein
MKIFFVIYIFVITTTFADDYFFDFQRIESANKYYHQNDFNKSSKLYKTVSDNKQNKESFYNLANSLYKQKEYQKSIDYYEKVVTTNQDLEFKKLHNIGNSYANLQNFEKAKEFYKKGCDLGNKLGCDFLKIIDII